MNSPSRAPTVSWQPVPQWGQIVSVSTEVPGPRLVAVGDAHQRADRADLHAVAALVAAGEAALEAGDRRVHALVDGAERHRADHLLAHPHAALALDAAVHVHDDDGAELDVLGVEDPLRLAEPADARPVCHHHVLQLALAALVADRAVERMVGEQHVEHEGAGVDHPGRVGVHDHAVGRPASRRRGGACPVPRSRPGTCGTRPAPAAASGSRRSGCRSPAARRR